MLFVILHIILCIIYLIIEHRQNERKHFLRAIVFAVPFCGFALWLIECYVRGQDLYGERTVDLDSLKVTDVKYRKLEVDDEDKTVVPLEEALIVNDTKLRRELMIDILHKNPEEYVDLLSRASGGDDVEVTHYATTTLLEIQGDYEKHLKDSMVLYESEQENIEYARQYKDALVAYTKSGLINGSILVTQQQALIDILDKLVQMQDKKQDILKYIEVALELKAYEKAYKMLNEKSEKLSDEMQWYKLAVRYYWEKGEKDRISETLDLIIQRNVYLTHENKRWYEYWRDGLGN